MAPALRQGILCLAGRFFPSFDLWQTAAQTRADLLWRLTDGSYLNRIYASTSDRRHQRHEIETALDELSADLSEITLLI